MRYRRLSDNQMVQDSEAVDAHGTLRSGYAMASNMLQPGQHIGFNMAFVDSAPKAAPVAISDADRTSIIARAQMIHNQQHAYLGDQAPAFTAQQAEQAVQAVRARPSASHSPALALADAAPQLAAIAQARANMIDRLTNAHSAHRN